MSQVWTENEIYGKVNVNPSMIYLKALEKDYNFFIRNITGVFIPIYRTNPRKKTTTDSDFSKVGKIRLKVFTFYFHSYSPLKDNMITIY